MTSRGDVTRFPAKLGRLLLLSYAAGVAVEGEWSFVDTDEVVPDFVTVVRRVDGKCDGQAPDADVTFESADVGQFKTDLYDLLLGEFAAGNVIIGTWRIAFAPSELPEWFVRIERVGSAADLDHLRGTN